MSESEKLSHDQLSVLINAAQSGEADAMERIITANIPLVRSIIRKYMNRGAEYDDLFQIGCMGLVKAVRNFDASFEVRFSTYAVPMIAGEIKRFLRDDGMIKVSRSLKELAAKTAASREKLSTQLGRDPSLEELAADTGAEAEDIVMAAEASRPHISIYEPMYGEDSDALVIDRAADENDETGNTLDRVMVKELLNTLPPKERQLIMLRFFGDKTQTEIAKVMGVSQVQISRMESRILKKLRELSI